MGPAKVQPGRSRLVADTRVLTDGTVRVYDVRTGQQSLALKGPAALHDPVFSPDGLPIAVRERGNNGVVRVNDSRTGQEACVLKGPGPWNENHTEFSPVVFSPDGSRIAVRPQVPDTGSRFACTWHTGQEAFALAPDVFRAVFSPDGARILAHSYSREAVVAGV